MDVHQHQLTRTYIKNGDEEPITCRPPDLLEPELENARSEEEEKGIANSEEDVLAYLLYPTVAEKFLKGEAVS